MEPSLAQSKIAALEQASQIVAMLHRSTSPYPFQPNLANVIMLACSLVSFQGLFQTEARGRPHSSRQDTRIPASWGPERSC